MSTGRGRRLEQRSGPHRQLAETLATLFTPEERRVLLRELGTRPDEVIPEARMPRTEAWAIVDYFDHRGRLDDLVGRVRAERPHAFTQPAPTTASTPDPRPTGASLPEDGAPASASGASGGADLIPEQVQAELDLLILSALTEEGQVVEAVLNQLAKRVSVNKGVRYFNLELGTNRALSVATACAHTKGAVALGVFAARLLRALSPQAATLVGIAAAVDTSEVVLGDVPFASHVIKYDDIAVQDQTLTFRTEGLQVDPKMRRAAGELRLSAASYERWQADCEKVIPDVLGYLGRFRGKQIVSPPVLHRPHLMVEFVGGGPFLLRDADFRDALSKVPPIPSHRRIQVASPVHPKLVSAEMESHGFMAAALEEGVPATVIKGISDLGDGNKGALEAETGGFFRAYACSNAVVAALHILREQYSSEPGAQGASGPPYSAEGESSGRGGSEIASRLPGATMRHEPAAEPQSSPLAAIHDDKAHAPDWLAFRAPEFTARGVLIPESAVRVIRTTDQSGQALGAADLATGLAERLSLLVIDGPQLSGKTWHAREVAAVLAEKRRDVAEVYYVLVPAESLLDVLRLENRSDRKDGSDLHLLAALGHKTIEGLRAEIPPAVWDLLQHDSDAAFIVKAASDYRSVLRFMRGQLNNEPGRRLIDILGDFLRRALESVPVPWANAKPVLILVELQESQLLDPESSGLSALRDGLCRLVREEVERPVWQLMHNRPRNVNLLVTGRQMEGLSLDLPVPNPNHPVRPLSWFTPADCRRFLSDPRVREAVGQEEAEALLTPDSWALTAGHPWFFSRLVDCLAALRSGRLSLGIGDPVQLVSALASGSGLWLFESPFDRPETLLADDAFPETPAIASLFLKRTLAHATRAPTDLAWLDKLTTELAESHRTHVGHPLEYDRRALPWKRLGLVEFDSDGARHRYSSGIVQRHFSARRLETYVRLQLVLWKGHPWLPAWGEAA